MPRLSAMSVSTSFGVFAIQNIKLINIELDGGKTLVFYLGCLASIYHHWKLSTQRQRRLLAVQPYLTSVNVIMESVGHVKDGGY